MWGVRRGARTRVPRAFCARVSQARQGVYRSADRHRSTRLHRRRVGENEKHERRRGSKPRSIEECSRASLSHQARLDSRIGIGAGKRIGPSVLANECRVRTCLKFVDLCSPRQLLKLLYSFQPVRGKLGENQRIVRRLESILHGLITQKLLQRKTADSQEVQAQLVSAEAP